MPQLGKVQEAGADAIDAAVQADGVARAAKPQIGLEIDAVAWAMAQTGPAISRAGILDVTDVAGAAMFKVDAGMQGAQTFGHDPQMQPTPGGQF